MLLQPVVIGLLPAIMLGIGLVKIALTPLEYIRRIYDWLVGTEGDADIPIESLVKEFATGIPPMIRPDMAP